jgi:hypothetical protein
MTRLSRSMKEAVVRFSLQRTSSIVLTTMRFTHRRESRSS